MFTGNLMYVMENRKPRIYFAIPVLDEMPYLFDTLDCIANQSYKGELTVYVCVNQPASWWDCEEKAAICLRNSEMMKLLAKGYKELELVVLDKSGRDLAWQNKKAGVGMARKFLLDTILKQASEDDVIISMDADTCFEKDFVASVAANYAAHPKAAAVNIPYYHPLTGEEAQDRAMLHYELYLRNYMLNLLRIDSPYAFTALGSAIAFKAKVGRAVGGFDSHMAGEDFYFLQKIVKYGQLLLYNECKVFPSPRISHRVPFGTGPAIAENLKQVDSRYPLFHYSCFDDIAQTYQQIDDLFYQDIHTPLIDFINQHFPDEDRWKELRANYKTLPMFQKAFHHQIDGLRIFQYIRYAQQQIHQNDTACLSEYFHRFYPENKDLSLQLPLLDFQRMPIGNMQYLRDFMATEEDNKRKQRDMQIALKKKSNFAR